ncbi:hypothetical protein FQZ97_1171400 [compost metagenome]
MIPCCKGWRARWPGMDISLYCHWPCSGPGKPPLSSAGVRAWHRVRKAPGPAVRQNWHEREQQDGGGA